MGHRLMDELNSDAVAASATLRMTLTFWHPQAPRGL